MLLNGLLEVNSLLEGYVYLEDKGDKSGSWYLLQVAAAAGAASGWSRELRLNRPRG